MYILTTIIFDHGAPRSIKKYTKPPVDAKIIRDCNNRSKGYGFVSMEPSERGRTEAAQILQQVYTAFKLL